MYAIATLYLCTQFIGCLTATRSIEGMKNWLMADTKAECERLNTEFTETLIRVSGDHMIGVHVECSKLVGV